MGIVPFIIELLAPEDFEAFRDDFCPSCSVTEAPPGEVPTVSKRERLVELFRWLEPGVAGIREFHTSPFTVIRGVTKVAVLALGGDAVIQQVPTGEMVTVRRAQGEIFNTDHRTIFYAGDFGIEKVEGDLARAIVAAHDGAEGAPTLEAYLWVPVVGRLEDEIGRLKGVAWFDAHHDDVFQTIPRVMTSVMLSTLACDEITHYAIVVIKQILLAAGRKRLKKAKGGSHV